MNPISFSNFIYKLSFIKDYNIFNTIFYSLLGIFFYFFIVYPYILFRKIKVNFYFVLSVFCFVIVGAILRMFAFENINFLIHIPSSSNFFSPGFFLTYPNLFLFLSIFFLIIYELAVFFSNVLNKVKEKVLLFISVLILFPFLLLFLINIINWFYFLITIFSVLTIFFIVYFVFKKIKFSLLSSKINKLTFLSQILDSFTTFFSLVFLKNLFIEKHVLSHMLISVNPLFFFVFKIIFCLFLIYLIDKHINNQNLNNYFKLFIIIIGFSTGLRNLFLISLFL
jgi:uncharacterized membrane protein